MLGCTFSLEFTTILLWFLVSNKALYFCTMHFPFGLPSHLSSLSLILWVSAVEGCPLSGVPLYVFSTFELFLVLFLLSWLPRWTDLFAFFFVRVASYRLHSALVSALDSAKYVHCEAPAALSSPSSIAKKCCLHQLCPPLTSSCNACLSDACECKLTFLIMTAN